MSTPPVSAAVIPPPVPITDEKWGTHLQEYYQLSVALYSKPYTNPEQLFAQFRKLRELRPFAFEPFLPLFTFLLGNFDKARFASILIEAKECDYYLSYALILHVLHHQLTMGVHFVLPETRTLEILETLREANPDDLLVAGIIHQLSSGGKNIIANISPIKHCLTQSLQALVANDSPLALRGLLPKTCSLTGFSILHRYLALAYAQLGKFQQAKASLSRSSRLLEFHRYFTSDFIEKLVHAFIYDAFNIPVPSNVSHKAHDVLPEVIELLECTPPNPDIALKFVLASLQALYTDRDQLPLVYFGLRHLLSHFQYTYDLQALFHPLLELIVLTAEISHTLPVHDAWMTSRFKRLGSGDDLRLEIDFSNPVSSGQKPISSFRFTNKLSLEKETVQDLASCVTKQLYDFIIKLMEAATTHEGIGLKVLTPPPEDPLFFRSSLEKHLTRDEGFHSFYVTVNTLRTYLALKNRPFPLDQSFLDWAKFCVFAAETPVFYQSTMDKEIQWSFYPETFTEQKFKGNQQRLNSKIPILSAKKTPRDVRLAVRDTLLACHDLALRAEPVIFEKETLYGLYKSSKHLCGWRPGESLSEWCERLQNLQPLETGSKRSRVVLNFFQDFWKQFQKNLGTPKKITVDGFDKKIWRTLNKPSKGALSAKKTSPQKQSKIIPIANGILNEDQRLKELCKNTSMPTAQFIRLMAASLIVNAEYPSDQALHKVVVRSEEEAMLLCQHLLEVSTDRLVRRAIVHMGPNELTDTEVRAHLSNYLHPLLGAFKKPAHEKAPFQAAVVTNDYSLKKIAVFYPHSAEKLPLPEQDQKSH